MKINFLLKKIRSERNMTLSELSKISGISRSYLSYVERGERMPTLPILLKLAEALNVDEKELYEVQK